MTNRLHSFDMLKVSENRDLMFGREGDERTLAIADFGADDVSHDVCYSGCLECLSLSPP